ncbi:MAG: Do family serine endopeptidase [Bernardetiaceae bacterium]|nr:Do family serine endopeptidase [Bernardetiaceae bacterium]
MKNSIKLFLMMCLSAVLGGGIALSAYTYFVDAPAGQKDGNYFESATQKSKDKQESYLATGGGRPYANPMGEVDFVKPAEKVTPAVVHIQTFGSPSSRSSSQSRLWDEMFRDFFGDRGNPYQQKDDDDSDSGEVLIGSGSGVIISKDGYIVTNNHVIDNAERIKVVLEDKRFYTAELIGKDPNTDLALLKIEEKQDFSYLQFGDSDATRVGDWVMAVGNPFDLTSTVTAGIISAKARNINILRQPDGMGIESFIQTDAAVNPGNSGGALVNLEGDLIGINTAIATKTGSFSGYSFAVPANLVKKIVEDLRVYGTVQRGLLGVRIQEVDAKLAKEKDLPRIAGVYIASINEGSGADKAGLAPEDVITHIEGVEINSVARLQEMVARKRPGDIIEVVYLRKGKENKAKVTLQNVSGTTEIVKNLRSKSVSIKQLGAEVCKTSEEDEQKIGMPGIVVTKIKDGKLRKAGMSEGFIITHIDKTPITSVEELQAQIKNKEGAVLIEGFDADGERSFYALGL